MRGTHVYFALACLVLGVVATGIAGPTTTASAPSGPVRGQPLRVVYFFSATCLKCREAAKVVDAVEKHYGDRIRVERMDVHDGKTMELMLTMEDEYGSNETAPPKVFSGKQYLAGVEAISQRLDKMIAQELARQEALPTSQPTSEPASASRPSPTTAPASQARHIE
jgi:thiol-disulfide isomerase/thioredoxin